MKIVRDASLLPLNTFGMDVRCAVLIDYSSEDELVAFLRDDEYSEFRVGPLLSIGSGSNMLFTGDFPGVALHSSIMGIDFASNRDGSVTARAGAGVIWDDFCLRCAEEGLWGPENLSMIPGTVGASAVQNIGAYGREVSDIISEIVCLDTHTLQRCRIRPSECGYGYRQSRFKGEWKGRYIVLEVSYRLTRNYSACLDYSHVRASMQELYGPEPERGYTPSEVRGCICRIRSGKLPDPSVTGNAGSFFKNPFVDAGVFERICEKEGLVPPHYDAGEGLVKIPAAWLIDRCGLKGHRSGGAAVCESQPLVIVNATGTASPEDIITLENEVVDTVRARFGITLQHEVEHI